jgi:hypothetical protein
VVIRKIPKRQKSITQQTERVLEFITKTAKCNSPRKRNIELRRTPMKRSKSQSRRKRELIVKY